jgi:hypothetical protein
MQSRPILAKSSGALSSSPPWCDTSDDTMVRHKRRWLLLRVESTDDVLSSTDPRNEDNFPSRKDLNRVIRDTMTECFGVSATAIANDTQGTEQLYVPSGRQISRDYYCSHWNFLSCSQTHKSAFAIPSQEWP